MERTNLEVAFGTDSPQCGHGGCTLSGGLDGRETLQFSIQLEACVRQLIEQAKPSAWKTVAGFQLRRAAEALIQCIQKRERSNAIWQAKECVYWSGYLTKMGLGDDVRDEVENAYKNVLAGLKSP